MRSFKELPPNYKTVETLDGSQTLFSERFQEACHSAAGAITETHLHYLQGCQVAQKLTMQSSISILEVGFGLGIGFLETWKLLAKSSIPWHFLSLEIDPALLNWFKDEFSQHDFLKHLEWKESSGLKWLEARSASGTLIILCGDARQTLPEFKKRSNHQWDVIYQDAFSPRRNPHLWTVEWFELLKSGALPGTRLSTYSASASVRKSMYEAGWKLHNGEKFGEKRLSTRAILEGETDPVILDLLKRSPIAALRDDNIEEFLRR